MKWSLVSVVFFFGSANITLEFLHVSVVQFDSQLFAFLQSN